MRIFTVIAKKETNTNHFSNIKPSHDQEKLEKEHIEKEKQKYLEEAIKEN